MRNGKGQEEKQRRKSILLRVNEQEIETIVKNGWLTFGRTLRIFHAQRRALH